MTKALIKLAYRQVINAESTSNFEQRVFNDSYAEFLMKIQAYNPDGKFEKYSEIVANDGRANSLHYKTSFAILHHLEELKGKIPGLYDSADRIQLSYEVPEFKLIESGINDKSIHKVAITYITGTLTLIDTIGDFLLLAVGDQSEKEEMETFMLRTRPGISISSYKSLLVKSDASEIISAGS